MAYVCEDVPVRVARDGNEEYNEAWKERKREQQKS